MKQRITFIAGALVLLGASLFVAWQLALPTRAANADAETFARANQLYENGNYGAAANLYQQLIAGGIENAKVFYNLGVTYAALGDAKQADEMFASAAALAPREPAIAEQNARSVPFTQNEIALLMFAIVSSFAVVFVLSSPRVLFKKRATV